MNLHEYQAKEILSGYGVRIQRGYVASSPEEAVDCLLYTSDAADES